MERQQAMIKAVRERIGGRAVAEDADAIQPWLTDWRGRWTGRSLAVLEPSSTEEVAAVVKLAAEHRVALVPQGGNTSMVGGATPAPDGSELLLSLRRLSRLRELGPDFAVVEAGVILANLHEAAAKQGRRFPLTLGARGSATVGGLAATNAGGTQVLRFGTMRRLVQGVEAVLADGSVHSGLAGLKKDNRGYNLDQLLLGSEGTLGIITAVRVALVPAIASRAVAWVGIGSPQEGLALLRRMEMLTDQIEGFEILPAESLAAVLRHVPGTRAPLVGQHAWHVLVEATASSKDDEAPGVLLERLLAEALDLGMAENATIAANETQAEAFWRIRDSLSEAERALGPAVQHDISVPVDAMPRFLDEAARAVEQAFPGTHASGFGHLGDGNIHFHVRAPVDAGSEWVRGEGQTASRLVHDLVTAAGGSISAEHGIGQMKRDELARLMPPADYRALRAIKAALDPLTIFNPGKLL